jgi:hypothetical protein
MSASWPEQNRCTGNGTVSSGIGSEERMKNVFFIFDERTDSGGFPSAHLTPTALLNAF